MHAMAKRVETDFAAELKNKQDGFEFVGLSLRNCSTAIIFLFEKKHSLMPFIRNAQSTNGGSRSFDH